ncbi:hypothetical protein [Hoylesella marshii]|uniref:Uncharacterized protein n=1 Tax=Hoylesella marshii DSM 16973 = JCM 13450 TaxID=862515 RepID=E0NVN4_9BACT|nr:hypothetical protein [Hoylesella marshii]EFM00816.1 hypothetical protein HMPREF0658_2239 [Hoylesella marshii DSM 16973 = JCM 13450]
MIHFKPFNSFFDALYWATVTLTTNVVYGFSLSHPWCALTG